SVPVVQCPLRRSRRKAHVARKPGAAALPDAGQGLVRVVRAPEGPGTLRQALQSTLLPVLSGRAGHRLCRPVVGMGAGGWERSAELRAAVEGGGAGDCGYSPSHASGTSPGTLR